MPKERRCFGVEPVMLDQQAVKRGLETVIQEMSAIEHEAFVIRLAEEAEAMPSGPSEAQTVEARSSEAKRENKC